MARAAAAGVMAVADNLRQVEWWNAAAKAPLDMLVDLDVGDHRTGARSIEQALEVAEAIDRAAHLRFRGIQAYAARGAHSGGFEARKKVSEAALQLVAEARDQMLSRGLRVEIVTGGSTGSWEIDTRIPVLTELQAGSYVFMDIDYRREGLDFAQALTVLTTVVSANHDAFVTVDGGFKAFSTDRGYGPEAARLPGSSYRWGGDEFGYLDLPADVRVKLGDKIEFVPPHCDPTMNLYDRIYACRGEEVLDVWPVKSLKVTQ
jgi:D-serine deaminase-like pyridoxal phosphate-dependent protein